MHITCLIALLSRYRVRYLIGGVAVLVLGCQNPSSDTERATGVVRLEPVAVLGSASDSISISHDGRVVQLASGEFLVMGEPFPRDRLLRYSSTGALLGTVGQPGEGPGEFRAISDIRVIHDSVLVAEENGRISSISSDFRISHVTRIPGFVQRMWVSPRGELMLMGMGLGPSPAPVHSYRASDYLGGLKPREAIDIRSRPSAGQRHVAFAPDSTIWAVRPDRYELEQYDITGKLIRVIDHESSWLPDRDYELAIWPEPPSPFIVDMSFDSLGHLLVAGWVANEPFDVSFKPGALTPEVMRRWRDGILDVVDVSTGQVVASTRVDAPILGFASANIAYSFRQDDAGASVIDVWRIDY